MTKDSGSGKAELSCGIGAGEAQLLCIRSSEAPFPVTPALSLGEREESSAVARQSERPSPSGDGLRVSLSLGEREESSAVARQSERPSPSGGGLRVSLSPGERAGVRGKRPH